MIWYLLYPFRGTTEAPALSPAHPLRRCFNRYGRNASRLAVTTLLISAAVATILIYPIPFLFTTDFINGASNLPHHVWTVAQPLPYDATVVPDILMRSIWIHSSYMQALNPEILLSALELQDALLGETNEFGPGRSHGASLPDKPGAHLNSAQRDALHVVNGLTNQSWIFQSPLLYWNCSRERILADQDILATINDKKNQSTPANITLRHSIVFSGKRFEDRRLLAADALVITLLYLMDSPVGRQWENAALSLPAKVGHQWDLYPADGRVSSSQLYEFQFRPISMQDTIVLSVAYSLTLFYFLATLSKLRAVKSKFGLIITIMTQIFFSIMSSFTICAIFNIDLSRIPRAAYPLVVLSMSLENTFRLINAVILTPSEDSTINRIGYAFGETAHIALTSALQNVIILVGLSYLVSPGVSAFCIFAAVAIVFDFFFLSTFFLSVLSVDVRRTELVDALAKEAMRHNHDVAEARAGSSWLRSVLRGKTALSTRIAGTTVMIGFVLIAQWHFFGGDDIFQKLVRLHRDQGPNIDERLPRASLLEDIHQARSPTSWLRLQDHDAAHEIIRIIKPTSYSYIARVYEPLVFVKKGSDRTPWGKEPALLPAAYDFVHHQLGTFVVIVIVVVAALRLLTSYLLLEDETKPDERFDPIMTPNLTVTSLSGGHTLDIVMLAESSGGLIVSIGLDRVIRVWDVRGGGKSYAITGPGMRDADMFPVLAVAIDEDMKWLALLSPSKIFFWALSSNSWGPSVSVKGCNQKPEAFFFHNCREPSTPNLVLIWRDGRCCEIDVSLQETLFETIIFPQLISARHLIHRWNQQSHSKVSIVAASRQGSIHIAKKVGASWESCQLPMKGFPDIKVHQIAPISNLPYFLIGTTDKVFLISLEDGVLLYTFQVEKMQPRSLECSYTCHRSTSSSLIGLTSFTLAYTSITSGSCVLQGFSAPDRDAAICLQNTTETPMTEWCTWKDSKELKKSILNPGVWKLSSDGSAVGLRRKAMDDSFTHGEAGLRMRSRFQQPARRQGTFRSWEIWRASVDDAAEANESKPLFHNKEDAGHLVVSELGPKINIGLASVAFAFGHVIKVVTVGGHARFGTATETHESQMSVSSRRRRFGGLTRSRASS